MSELTDTFNDHSGFRRRLLATVSAIALLGSANWMDIARAADDDGDRPLIWIELGGQAEQLSGKQQTFVPSFTSVITQNGYPSPTAFEKNASWMIGGEGKVSFQPEGSDWLFSASVRFGRANSQKSNRVQKTAQFSPRNIYSAPSVGYYHLHVGTPRAHTGYSDIKATASESYAVIDFQAGKDMGIGRIGNDGVSEFAFGVRFAQFQSKSNIRINADPDYHLAQRTTILPHGYIYPYGPVVKYIHRSLGAWNAFHASAQSARSFHGIGPSISWNASSPLMGSVPDGELTFDWGVNGAVLFGRQRAQVHHQTTAQYHTAIYPFRYTISSQHNAQRAPARTVIVPNAGGFAGLSFRFTNAKVSLGYRGDYFFGAMDGGIDTAKKENIGFYGPFASISVGIGG